MSAAAPEAAPASQKADDGTEDAIAPTIPEGFQLRGDVPRVMRLSRKALAVIGATSGFTVAGALIYALQPDEPKRAANVYESDTPNRSEIVTGAPADYRRIPKLGAPLPGDLGHAMLAAERKEEASASHPLPSAPPVDPRVSAAEQARARARQEGQAAHSSGIFLADARGDGTKSGAPVGSAAAGAEVPAQALDGAANRQTASARGGTVENPARLTAPASPHVVQAGSVIPAALITGIRSDLPGQITAQVTQNVFDSPTGRVLLIPQGTRLIGTYGSDIAAGQSRVLLLWSRLILPGGRSFDLGGQPGADASGMSGLADRTDHHWGHMLKAALISTLLGAGAEFGTDGDDRLVRALREGSQDTVGEAGRQLVSKQMAIPPTITIRPGVAMRVIVTRDLVLEPFAEGSS